MALLFYLYYIYFSIIEEICNNHSNLPTRNHLLSNAELLEYINLFNLFYSDKNDFFIITICFTEEETRWERVRICLRFQSWKAAELEFQHQGSRPEVSSVPWKTTLLCRLESKENKEKLDSEWILGFEQQLGTW